MTWQDEHRRIATRNLAAQFGCRRKPPDEVGRFMQAGAEGVAGDESEG